VDDVLDFQTRLERLLAPAGWPWRVEVVASTGSTNVDLVERARRGRCPEYTVLVALEQVAGRGRLDRTWSVPPGTSVTMSMAVPLPSDQASLGLVPLATGVAVVRAVDALAAATGLPARMARLKWPNDITIGEKKLCGILVEVAGRLAVIGVGINVAQTAENIGLDSATSLVMAGLVRPGGRSGPEPVAREDVAAAVLAQMGTLLPDLDDPDGRRRLLAEYRGASATIGRRVEIHANADQGTALGLSERQVGEALDITDDGQLLVVVDGQTRAFASGDVVHVRGAGATAPMMTDDEFIATGWPARIQPVAGKALDIWLLRGRFSEDVDEEGSVSI